MTGFLWALGVYVALSILMGLGAAWIAWDYDPWEAFWVTATMWPLLLLAFFFP